MPVFSCGRSLYIDWRMVVMVVGGCPTPCKKGGGIVRAGEMSGVICPRRKMSYTLMYTSVVQDDHEKTSMSVTNAQQIHSLLTIWKG